MQRVASFELSPPLAAPLRFFLTAPLFAMAAGLLLAWAGPAAFASRWTPTLLALTHLLTLGFLGMAMLGALVQILPVVAGVALARTALTARVVHLLVAAGILALASGFLLGEPRAFPLAMMLLGGGFGWFLLAAAIGARGGGAAGFTARGIRLALAALLVTVVLGLTLAAVFGGLLPWPPSIAGSTPAGLSLPLFTDVHAVWGLGGWVGVLVIGVAYQVVPMFQVTQDYPLLLRRWLPRGLVLLIALWSVALLVDAIGAAPPGPDASGMSVAGTAMVSAAAAGLAAAGYAAFAFVTLRLLWRRKRPKPEATTFFWYLGMVALLGCAFVAATLALTAPVSPAWPLALGVLAVVGFAGSVVNGMLYRIVPFLHWYHLQTAAAGNGVRVPNARDLIGQAAMTGQLIAHLAAFALLMAATIRPDAFAQAAGLALLCSQAWLWLNLRGAGAAANAPRRNAGH